MGKNNLYDVMKCEESKIIIEHIKVCPYCKTKIDKKTLLYRVCSHCEKDLIKYCREVIEQHTTKPVSEGCRAPLTPRGALNILSRHDWLRERQKKNHMTCDCNGCFVCAYNVLNKLVEDFDDTNK